MTEHNKRAHSVLSASGSKRWLSCPPSARIEEQYPESSSDASEEGTLAHEIAELYLRHALGEFNKRTLTNRLAAHKKHRLFQQEIIEYVEQYVTWIMEQYNEVKALDATAYMLLEEKLDYSRYAPTGYGSVDVLIIAGMIGRIHVIDLKYGKGVLHHADTSTQLRMYGLGALEKYDIIYDFSQVDLSIYQPRVKNFSTHSMDKDELVHWGENVVMPTAELAFNGEGEFCAGEHCKYCKIESNCTARAEYYLALADREFTDLESIPTISPEKRAEILPLLSGFAEWIKKFEENCLTEMLSGRIVIPGYKIVDGKSSRSYPNVEGLVSTLVAAGFDKASLYKEPELITIGSMEKLVGKKKFGELAAPFAVYSEPKPALVPESDKRPAVTPSSKAEADFSDLATTEAQADDLI